MSQRGGAQRLAIDQTAGPVFIAYNPPITGGVVAA